MADDRNPHTVPCIDCGKPVFQGDARRANGPGVCWRHLDCSAPKMEPTNEFDLMADIAIR